jgi:hypothetical protein
MRDVVWSAFVLLFALPSALRAQDAVQVCMPEAATREMRDAMAVEIRARGHDVIMDCAPSEPRPLWTFSFEVEDALADVWVRATSASGEERRARIGGPLDTLDERAVALTAASLLEEETVLPEPSNHTEPVLESIPSTPLVTTPSEPESSSSEAAPNAEEPIELVESDRALSIVAMLEFGVVAGFVSGENGTIGGRVGVGLHFSPWMRWRILGAFSVAPDRGSDLQLGMGFDFVISLVREESWLELGVAARYASQYGMETTGSMFWGLGPGLNAAFFYALSDTWRVFVRGEGMALFGLNGGDPQYGFYLSSGFAVFL